MNKYILITGGSSGIGEACIAKFLAHKHKVFNLDIKNNAQFEQDNNYSYHKTDISDEQSILDTLNGLNIPHLDTVIISAGIHLSANIENTTMSELLNIININLLGAFLVIKYSIPYLKKNGGSIITIGSDQYMIAKPNSSAYGMTKAALAQLTKSIALDYAKDKITANCIGAGTIDTPLFQQAIKNYANKSGINLEEIINDENNQQPIGRIGKASEIAELCYYLSSDKARFITGAYMPIDGGYTTG